MSFQDWKKEIEVKPEAAGYSAWKQGIETEKSQPTSGYEAWKKSPLPEIQASQPAPPTTFYKDTPQDRKSIESAYAEEDAKKAADPSYQFSKGYRVRKALDAKHGTESQGRLGQVMVGSAVKEGLGAVNALLQAPQRWTKDRPSDRRSIEAAYKEEDALKAADPNYEYSKGYRLRKGLDVKVGETLKQQKDFAAEHQKGIDAIMASHPEWADEPPEGFIDMVTSPRKLLVALSGSAPVLVGAGILTASGRGDLAFGMMYATEGQGAYDQAIADGATEEQAETAYHVYGGVAAVIESLQLRGLGKGFSAAKRAILLNKTALKVAGKSVTKELVKTAAEEAIEEMLQQGWSEATAKLVYDQNPKGGWRGVVDRQLMAGYVGGAMSLIPGLGGAARGGMQSGTQGTSQVTIQDEMQEIGQEEAGLTPERWQEIKDETGRPPSDQELRQFMGQDKPQSLFESKKIKEQQQAEQESGGQLVTQEQQRAFTPEEAPQVTEQKAEMAAKTVAEVAEAGRAGTTAPDEPVTAPTTPVEAETQTEGVIPPTETKQAQIKPQEPVKKRPNTPREMNDQLKQSIPLFNTGINTVLKTLDMSKMTTPERKSKQTSIDNAIAKGMPEKSVDLATELISDPRPISDEELAGMGVKLVQTVDEASGERKIIRSSESSDADKIVANARRDVLRSQIKILTEGMRKGKTQTARSLAMAGTFIDSDYNAESIITEMQEAKGADLTQKEEKMMDDLTDKLEKANIRISDLEKQMINDDANLFVRESGTRKTKKTKDTAESRSAKIKSLGKQIYELHKEGCGLN